MAEPSLEEVLYFLFVDCLYVSIRKEMETKNCAVYVILGYDVDSRQVIQLRETGLIITCHNTSVKGKPSVLRTPDTGTTTGVKSPTKKLCVGDHP